MESSTNSGFNSMVQSATTVDGDSKEKTLKLLDDFLSKYSIDSVSFNNELVSIIKQIQRRRNEFNATRFFVLVVGPVKSGKSTLVNIFAREYVSPTAYRECTALPTIIGKSSGEHLNKIVQYYPSESHSTDKDKIETFDYIVDVIREVETQDVLDGRIKKFAYDLTPEKIKETITLYHDSTDDQSDQLVATIGIKGGGFIDDEIMLIDMPGLDGSRKHSDNTLVYKSMAQRADVVFFVQSSTSAINKSSIDFLNELFADKKGQVPVWLVHNIHDSQYFIHDDEKKKAELQEQIKLGCKRIQESFGIIRFEHLALNLGKIYTALKEPERIKPEQQEEIDKILENYKSIESELIRVLKEERQAIKDGINIGKAYDVIAQSTKVINILIENAKAAKQKIEANIAEAMGLEQLLIGSKLTPTNFLVEYDNLIAKENIANSWECIIQTLVDQSTPRNGDKITGQSLIDKIDVIRLEACKRIPIGVGTNFRVQLCDSLYKDIQAGLAGIITEIEAKFKTLLQREDVHLTDKLHEIISEKLSTQAPHFTPFYSDIQTKTLKIFNKKYNMGEQIGYLNLIKTSLTENIPAKFTEYRNLIKADYSTIRDEHIAQLKSEIQQMAAAYKKEQEAIIGTIEKEIETMQQMLKDLEY